MKRNISIILRAMISLGLIGFLLWNMRDRVGEISRTIASTNIPVYALANLIFIANVGLLALRLGILIKGEELSVGFWKVVRISFVGFFFNNFMPTSVGGDIMKTYYTYRETNQATKSFVSVLMDRFIGLCSFVFIALFTLFASWNTVSDTPKKSVLLFASVGLFSIFIIMNRTAAKLIQELFNRIKLWNLGEKLNKIYRAVHEYRNKRRTVLYAILVSFASQSIYFSTVYLLARSMNVSIALTTVILMMPIVSVACMLPSLGGLGVREGAIVVLFGPLIGNDMAFSLSVLVFTVLIVLSLVGGLIYAFSPQFRLKRVDVSEIKNYDT